MQTTILPSKTRPRESVEAVLDREPPNIPNNLTEDILAQEIRDVASILKKPTVEDGFQIVTSKTQQKRLRAKQK